MRFGLKEGLLVLCILSACAGGETEAPGTAASDGTGRDTAIAVLDARVDSLEEALAAIIEQYGTHGAAPAREEASEETGAAPPPPRPDPEQAAAERPGVVRYATYRNVRLGYTVDYPVNVMLPVEMLGNGNGQRFATDDGSATLAVYGVEDVAPGSLRALYDEELLDPNRRVTYKVLRKDWFVLSGYVGDDVFYERTILRGDILKTFLLLYDASAKAYYDPITKHISLSFEG